MYGKCLRTTFHIPLLLTHQKFYLLQLPPPGTLGNGTTGSDASSSNASIIYEWEQSVDNGTSWITIVGATNTSYSPPALAQTTIYRRKAIASLSGTSCEDVTNPITITVTTLLNAGNVFQSQTLCNALFPNALVLTDLDATS